LHSLTTFVGAIDLEDIQPHVIDDTDMVEQPYDLKALEKLLANFDKIIRAVEIDNDEDGVPDSVMLDDGTSKSIVSIKEWGKGNFNYLNQKIDRDDSQKVENNMQLIESFNTYKFEGQSINGSGLGQCVGNFLTIVSAGTWLLSRRKTVPPGYFGHKISSSRHILTPPGIHVLYSSSEKWANDIIIDDEANPNRKFGDKVILQIPENHLAGGYRIGAAGNARDQEYVLFSQGRHVLPESKYYGVNIIKLTESRMALGPLTVLYVREGWLGGCIHRKTGVYRVLYPGPPYILHEQDYEQVELIHRVDDLFRLGPYEFVTVKDGQIAGCYRKSDGKFQILPPGRSYQLHSKNFSEVTLMNRSKEFKLGPFYYLTVSNGEEAGVYRKKDGLFVRLKPGKTYQLNEDSFQKPVVVKRNSHVTKVGPLTLLTVEQGTLNGAYKVSDGSFVEFEDKTNEYILHEKEYHGLVTVLRNSTLVQYFGPFKVVTIRDGYVGQFEVEGKIDIKQPGYYKVESNVNIYDPIPVKMFQDILPELEFRTKDGVSTGVKATIMWHVTNAEQVAIFPGKFQDLHKMVQERAGDALVRLCKMYNRGDLLPTAQDLEELKSDGLGIAEMNKLAEEKYRALQNTLQDTCKKQLNEISNTSKLGISVEKVQIERFQLKNEGILIELEAITKAQLSANRERAQGEYMVVKANVEKEARQKQAEANAQVSMTEARAKAEIRKTEEEAENHVRQEKARVNNKIKEEEEKTAMQILYDKEIRVAEGRANAIRAITEAEYLKTVKECEAASKMAPQEFQLKQMELQVQMLKEIGAAAWQYPDIYTGFLSQFGDKLRLGPLSVSETLAKLSVSEAKGQDEKDVNLFNPLSNVQKSFGGNR
jgi:regulator of protease activity HflC (stomatin/prohibitin superfamily)